MFLSGLGKCETHWLALVTLFTEVDQSAYAFCRKAKILCYHVHEYRPQVKWLLILVLTKHNGHIIAFITWFINLVNPLQWLMSHVSVDLVPSPQSSHCSLQPPLTGRSYGGLAERSPSFLYHTATHSKPHHTHSSFILLRGTTALLIWNWVRNRRRHHSKYKRHVKYLI